MIQAKQEDKYPWASRHSTESWRDHYRWQSTYMDKEIDNYKLMHPSKFQDKHGLALAFKDNNEDKESMSDEASIYSFTG